MARILLLENPHSSADDVFTKAGHEIIRVTGALQGQELINALQGVQMLGIRSKTTVTREVLEACPDLVAIGAYCIIGTNQIDLQAANETGVSVFNAALRQYSFSG